MTEIYPEDRSDSRLESDSLFLIFARCRVNNSAQIKNSGKEKGEIEGGTTADEDRKSFSRAEVRNLCWGEAFAISLITSLPYCSCECHHWLDNARGSAWVCVCVGAAPASCGAKKIYTTFVRLRTRKTGLCGGESVARARARTCVRVLSTVWPYRDSIVPADSVGELRLEGSLGFFP